MKTIYKLLSIIVLLSFANTSIGQNDYVIEYSTKDTCISTTVSEYDKVLRHIIPDKEEITHLYKLDLIQLAQQKLNFSFEHVLKPKLSIEHSASFNIEKYIDFSNYPEYEVPNFFQQFSKQSLYYLTLNTNLKYYHNLDKRINRGKSTNGFSANYFVTGVKIKMAFYDTNLWKSNSDGSIYQNSYDSMNKSNLIFILGQQENKESMGYINFGYGLQRRIGNIGYWSAEAKAGIGTNKYFDTIYIPFELNLRAGFALSSFKRKR